MTMKSSIQGIYFLSSLFFLSTQVTEASSAQITQIQNIARVLKNISAQPAIKNVAKTPSAKITPSTALTPPATPIALMAYNLNGTACSAPFIPVKALNGAAYNSSALSCAGGLQYINIALTDAKVTDWSSSLQIPSTILSQPVIVNLMKSGMYIAINMLQNPAGSPAGNYIQICLTDVSGNVYAQSPLVLLPSGIGFAYANVGFNVYNTEAGINANQTYVNWMPIANGQRIFYQDQGAATTVTTPGIGGQSSTPSSMPVKIQVQPSTVLTPPATPIAASNNLKWRFGNLPKDWPATATSNVSLGSWPLASIQQNTPISCAGGLQFVAIYLVNSQNTGALDCVFQIQKNATLTQLAAEGLYIAVQVSNINASAGTSTITVSLTDISGNVFAQNAVNLSNFTGATYINVGFNHSATLSTLTPPSGKAFVNWVPIASSQRIYYKQAATNSASFGGIVVPAISAQGLSPASGETSGQNSKLTSSTTSTPPATPIALMAYNLNGTACSAPFIPVKALNGAAYNSSALSCAGGLQYINIALTDAKVTDWSSSLQIPSTILSQPVIVNLMKSGMYIAINMLQNPAGSPAGNYIQICLTDVSGNVYAQSPLVLLPSGIGFAYANVGFNVYNTEAGINANQTYVNWMPIANGQRIFYQDQGAATTITTPGFGGQSSTPPIQTSTTVTSIFDQIDLNPTLVVFPQDNFTLGNGPFVATTNTYTGYNSYNSYVVQMLQQFHIRLYNSANIAKIPAFISFDFDFSSNTAMQNQLNQAMQNPMNSLGQGVGCYWIAQIANNQNEVVVYFVNGLNSQPLASYSYQLPAGSVAPDSAYMYFNKSDSSGMDGIQSYAIGPVAANQGVRIMSGFSGPAQPAVSVPSPLP